MFKFVIAILACFATAMAAPQYFAPGTSYSSGIVRPQGFGSSYLAGSPYGAYAGAYSPYAGYGAGAGSYGPGAGSYGAFGGYDNYGLW